MSVPNQKKVIIHKPKYKGNFLQIGIDEWQQAIKTMKKGEFALYLYLASNADEFNLELSRQAFENATGYKKTSYNKAVERLQELGYLVPIKGNLYQFYTSPRRQSERAQFSENTDNLLNGGGFPLPRSGEVVGTNRADRSINTEIDNIDKTDRIDNAKRERKPKLISIADVLLQAVEEERQELPPPQTCQEELVRRVRGY